MGEVVAVGVSDGDVDVGKFECDAACMDDDIGVGDGVGVLCCERSLRVDLGVSDCDVDVGVLCCERSLRVDLGVSDCDVDVGDFECDLGVDVDLGVGVLCCERSLRVGDFECDGMGE